jgi:hypothetical protein
MTNLTAAQILALDNMCRGAEIGTLGTTISEIQAAVAAIPEVLVAAVAGDLIFSVSPATTTETAAAQNVGVAQVTQATITGAVTAGGGGDITVTVTAEGMENSPKDVTVTVDNSDAAADIADKIRTALTADADVGHVSTGFFTVSGDTDKVILTSKAEATNDDTVTVEAVTDTAVIEEASPLGTSITISTEGVAPYTRSVVVSLVDTAGNVHSWFSGTVPITIADTASGTASIATTSPTMTNGVMTIPVTLMGTFAGANTNTLTVSQKTILGATVTAKTSVQTTT